MIPGAPDPPAYLVVAADLRRQILTGQLGPGYALPSETALQQIHDVSRPTVRRAIWLLRSEGLVVTEQGRGTFVRDVGERREVRVPAGVSVEARMPTPEEAAEFGLPAGVPVLVVARPDGVEVLPADRVKIVTC